ncbi:filamentous hemagglutinin N-terminal domain-containing protein [Campylobacter coli]
MALSQSLAAVTLPSGGKFVNGTGSITKPNDNTMNIAGDKTHNVIAWGGGFNIGKGYTVDFTTENLNYLNLDYTNKASQILGTLNGRTNSVYIVNPSGVLIGEGATINANKFGVSTTPMDINEINDFSDNGSFSAAFDANKGDVVNMGTINANEIVLVGNKVENIKGTLQSKDQGFADQVTIKGNKVYLEGVGIKATNLDATINEDGYFAHDTGILYDAYVDNKQLVYSFKGNAVNNKFKEYLYIGGKYADNDQMINSWDGFINLFNEGKLQEWGFNDIYLGNDIDFAGKDVINPIGDDTNPFTANFYGNGYTLSNLQIGPSGDYVGLFGYINGGSVQDLTIDGMQFRDGVFYYKYIGGLAGYIANGFFSNITLRNITGEIYSAEVIEGAGGFAGYIGDGKFDNIILDTIKDFNDNLSSITSGGFAGEINTGTFDNISLSNLGNIGARDYAGGFAGKINGGSYINIDISKIGDVNEGAKASIVSSSKTDYEKGSYAGGFAGYIESGTYLNIVLSDIAGINATLNDGKNFISDLAAYAGGFAGYIKNGDFRAIDFKNISTGIQTGLKGNTNVKYDYAGGFAGEINDGNFQNISLNDIAGSIDANKYSGGFAGKINGGDIVNIVLSDIEEVDGERSGGFAGEIDGGMMLDGEIEGVKLSNIVLNDINKIGITSGSRVGGFAGEISNAIFSYIFLNNIGEIKSGYSSGGFAGEISNAKLDHIILNNIENISGSYEAGGFAGSVTAGDHYKNIILNNILSIGSNTYAGGFAGTMNQAFGRDSEISNVVLNGIGEITANYQTGGFSSGGSLGSISFSKIYINSEMDDDKVAGLTHSSTPLDLSNGLTELEDQSGILGLEYFTDASTGDSYLHIKNDNDNIGDYNSEITFDEENFYNTPNIPEINPDGSGTSSLPEVPNEEKLSSVDFEVGDFEEEILKIIINDILNNEYVLNIDTIDFEKFNEDDLAIILYLLKNTADEALKESIRQSLDFYTEFNKGEADGLKSKFKEWYSNDSSSTYSISMDKYESIERLKGYVNGTLKPELESIRNNLNRFESLKAEIERLAKVYQEALDNNLLPYEQLEIIHKDTQEKIDAYYKEAKGLLETLHGDNKSFLVKLFEEKYNFSEIYKDNSLTTGSFSFVGSNVDGNLDYKGSLIGKEIEDSVLGGKPILSLPGNENSGDDQTINRGEGAEIAKTLAKQADLASGESVIVLPAEETQSVIDEGERELGRVCIVSDNAKTSNPCIAIAF